jgi:hypothetical protein
MLHCHVTQQLCQPMFCLAWLPPAGKEICLLSHSSRHGEAVSACRHIVGQFSKRESQMLCVHFIEKAIRACPPGIDTVIGIFDVAGFGLGNADLTFVHFLIEAFFFYYPKRAGEVLMVDAPWAFMPPFEMMRPLLGKYGELIRFVPRREALSYFRPGQAPRNLM